MYIHGLIPRNFVELAEAVPIDHCTTADNISVSFLKTMSNKLETKLHRLLLPLNYRVKNTTAACRFKCREKSTGV